MGFTRNERFTREVGKMVDGMTTSEAVAEIKAYLGAKHELHDDESIMEYWDSLTDEHKIRVIERALAS